MNTATRLEGIGEYYFSQKLREIANMNAEGRDIINLGIGSPDMPPHPSVISAMQKEVAVSAAHGYQGYKGVPALRKAFASWYEKWYSVTLDPETEILPLIGSKEGIMHICMTYLDAGDRALVPNPGYPTYTSAVKLAGGEPLPYELKESDGWEPDFEMLDRMVSSDRRIKMMFVNYPHMPTGRLPGTDLFGKIVSFARAHHILVCHDNPYSFILNDKPMSLLAIEGARDVVVELNSLSKSHNMAGWRVGVLCGSAQRINEVLRFKSNMDSGMFLPVQLAAARALELGRDWFEGINSVYRARKELALELLYKLGCRVAEGQAGMFVWAGVPDGFKDCFELSDSVLYDAAVFITPGGIFGDAGNRYVRVSLCSPEATIKKAIDRVEKIRS